MSDRQRLLQTHSNLYKTTPTPALPTPKPVAPVSLPTPKLELCVGKRKGGYSKVELETMAVSRGMKRSHAKRTRMADLCKWLGIPQHQAAEIRSTPNVGIILPVGNLGSPTTPPVNFISNNVSIGKDISNSPLIKSKELISSSVINTNVPLIGGVVGEPRFPTNDQAQCVFDSQSGTCILKSMLTTIKAIPLAEDAEEQLDELLDVLIRESKSYFSIQLREQLHSRYPSLTATQIEQAVRAIKDSNIGQFSQSYKTEATKVVERLFELYRRKKGASLSRTEITLGLLQSKEKLDNWIRDWVNDIVVKYDIKKSGLIAPDEQYASLQQLLSKTKEELSIKSSQLETLREQQIRQPSVKEENIPIAVMSQSIKEDQKRIESYNRQLQKVKEEIQAQIQQIKQYYASKGKQLDILNESHLVVDPSNQIKLVILEYSPEEAAIKHYADTYRRIQDYSVYLQKIQAQQQAIPQDQQQLRLDLTHRVGEIQIKIKQLQKELEEGLQKVRQFRSYDPSSVSIQIARKIGNDEILSGKAAKGIQRTITLEELIDEIK